MPRLVLNAVMLVMMGALLTLGGMMVHSRAEAVPSPMGLQIQAPAIGFQRFCNDDIDACRYDWSDGLSCMTMDSQIKFPFGSTTLTTIGCAWSP